MIDSANKRRSAPCHFLTTVMPVPGTANSAQNREHVGWLYRGITIRFREPPICPDRRHLEQYADELDLRDEPVTGLLLKSDPNYGYVIYPESAEDVVLSRTDMADAINARYDATAGLLTRTELASACSSRR